MFRVRVITPRCVHHRLTILPAQEEKFRDSWTRELGGALVEFKDGAAVAKVSHPTDFSAVRLSKLPEGSSPASVVVLLSTIGVVVPADDVRVITQKDMAACSADVKVEDPTFAKTLADKLRRLPATSHIDAVPIPVPMPPGSSLHRIDCRRVQCSWNRAAHTAWLGFEEMEMALEVHKRFNDGVYRVRGCNVKACAPARAKVNWSLSNVMMMLTDLDSAVTERDIERAIPQVHTPHRISMGRAAYTIDEDVAATRVQSMLLKHGALESWEVSTNPDGKRVKAQARFFDEAHARKAARSLNKTILPFSAKARLTVRLIISAKFKISARIYDALQQRLGAETPVWQSDKLYFVAYPPQKGYRVLKVEGENIGPVAEAKETIERIIGGEVVRKDGQDVWNTDLGRNGDQYKKVQQVGQEYGVVVMRDIRKSQLRVFGPEEACNKAMEALSALVQDGVSKSNILDAIELGPEEFRWACRGGFKALTSYLGGNKVTLDIVSTPSRILISGSKADYTSALAFITRGGAEPTTTPSASDTPTMDCSVCWVEAEDPIRTSCDHVYCLDCFHNLCQAEGSSSADFHISCVGGAGTCEKTLALPELQELLSSAAFEAVLDASFASYIRRHPASFCYCPTPDCGQIYRTSSSSATENSTMFICAKCLMPTCTACHAPHPNMTCAEHKYDVSGGDEAFQKIKRELGIKDCPKCKTAMEKTEGCNHMTCGGCGAHICWVCLAAFRTSVECYAHLNRKHGGIGVEVMWF
jgi:hypothetical protein